MKLSEWQQRVHKKYSLKDLFRDYLLGSEIFPRKFSLKKINGSDLVQNFSIYRESCDSLQKECEALGVRIVFANFQHRSLGTQSLPHELLFVSRETYLKFIGKEADFELFRQAVDSASILPSSFKDYFIANPLKLLEHPGHWARLSKVCQFFLNSPKSDLYLRQLEIPGVDTKFIEDHKKILMELVSAFHSSQDISVAEKLSLSVDHFEEHFGLKKESPRLRFRTLDPEITAHFQGLDDIQTTIASLQSKEIPCETVFIVENKITGLCLPAHPQSIVFFELGYKAVLLKELPWLQQRRLIYWGDLDTHGFAILSQLRQHLPHVQSILMDQGTLLHHQNLWTIEDRPNLGHCPYLTEAETKVFTGLQKNLWGSKIRLEQEHLALTKFAEALRSI